MVRCWRDFVQVVFQDSVEPGLQDRHGSVGDSILLEIYVDAAARQGEGAQEFEDQKRWSQRVEKQ
jgi:hypothetical protein